jgi:hypothetical protein
MEKLAGRLMMIFVALSAMMLWQCSSTLKSAGVASSPDVSQVPTLSDTLPKKQANMPDDLVVMMGSPSFYQTPTASGKYDSIQTTTEATAPRIVHISASDFSVYDTRHDSTVHNSGKSKHVLPDSASDVAILSPGELRSLTLNLSKSELVVLSLVNEDLFENFEKEDLEKKFAQYGASYILITVAKKDSKQRTAFVIQFYQEHLRGKKIETAFKAATEDAQRQHGTLDFKAQLIKNR